MGVLLVRSEVGVVVLSAPSHVSYDEHVPVRPVTWSRIWRPAAVPAETDSGNAPPVVTYVAGGSPAVGVFDIFLGQRKEGGVGETVDDVPAALLQLVVHLLHAEPVVRVPVVLQIVESPFRPLARVLSGE